MENRIYTSSCIYRHLHLLSFAAGLLCVHQNSIPGHIFVMKKSTAVMFLAGVDEIGSQSQGVWSAYLNSICKTSRFYCWQDEFRLHHRPSLFTLLQVSTIMGETKTSSPHEETQGVIKHHYKLWLGHNETSSCHSFCSSFP